MPYAGAMIESLESRQLYAAQPVGYDVPAAKHAGKTPAVTVEASNQALNSVNVVVESGQAGTVSNTTTRTFVTGWTVATSGKKSTVVPVYTTYTLGTVATVTPVFLANGTISVAVDATCTQLLGVTTERVKTAKGWMTIEVPTIVTQTVKTTATLQSGQTIALAGSQSTGGGTQLESVALMTVNEVNGEGTTPTASIQLRFVAAIV